MGKDIVVLDADAQQCQTLCSFLKEHQYQAVPAYSLQGLETYIRNNACLSVIMDIDSVPVDNRSIRLLALGNPGIYFLCLSEDRFHPQLKEALCYYIYACIKKPVDTDELLYWLESICEHESKQ